MGPRIQKSEEEVNAAWPHVVGRTEYSKLFEVKEAKWIYLGGNLNNMLENSVTETGDRTY